MRPPRSGQKQEFVSRQLHAKPLLSLRPKCLGALVALNVERWHARRLACASLPHLPNYGGDHAH